MIRSFLLCAFVSSFSRLANALPSGAPAGTCITMAPSATRHGADPQVTTAPYVIEVDKTQYSQNSVVTVSVKASGDATIGGFLIEAREEGEEKPLGRFDTIPQLTKHLDCTSFGAETVRAAVTQSQVLQNAKMLTFEWKPSAMTNGNIYFIATIAQSRQTYWLGVKSVVLQKMEIQPTQSTQPPVGTVQGNVSTTSQTVATSQPEVPLEQIVTTSSYPNLVVTSGNLKSTTSTAAPTSMTTSTSGYIHTSTPTGDNRCIPAEDPKCDGAQLNHNVLLLVFIGLFLVFRENLI